MRENNHIHWQRPRPLGERAAGSCSSRRLASASGSPSGRFVAVVAALVFSAGLAACSNTSNIETVPRSESTITTISDVPFSAHFEIVDTELVAGENGSGWIVLDNRTGAPIVSKACTLYTPELRRSGRGQDLPALTCAGLWMIAVGEMRVPITFSTLDSMCSGSQNRGLGSCLPDGKPPKLEPNDYELTAWSMDRNLPTPPPVKIHVTP